MSSLLGFSLVHLLQPYILPEPDVMPSMSLVLSPLLGFLLLSLPILFLMGLILSSLLFPLLLVALVCVSALLLLVVEHFML